MTTYTNVGIDISGTAEIEPVIDGSSAATGEINEVLTASQASITTTNVAASGTFGYATSLSVTAGRWLLTAIVGFDDNGATMTTAVEAAISASATGAGISIVDKIKDDSVSGSTLNRSFAVPSLYITIGATTTYYLNTKMTYTAGTPGHFGKLVARRVG